MIFFRDKMFCPFYHDCLGSATCGRALTRGVRVAAKKMKLGVAYFLAKPPCFQDKKAPASDMIATTKQVGQAAREGRDLNELPKAVGGE